MAWPTPITEARPVRPGRCACRTRGSGSVSRGLAGRGHRRRNGDAGETGMRTYSGRVPGNCLSPRCRETRSRIRELTTWGQSGGAAGPDVRPGLRSLRSHAGAGAIGGRLPGAGHPPAQGPSFAPQAGARAARRIAHRAPSVACPRAASPRAPRLRRFERKPFAHAPPDHAPAPEPPGKHGRISGLPSAPPQDNMNRRANPDSSRTRGVT